MNGLPGPAVEALSQAAGREQGVELVQYAGGGLCGAPQDVRQRPAGHELPAAESGAVPPVSGQLDGDELPPQRARAGAVGVIE